MFNSSFYWHFLSFLQVKREKNCYDEFFCSCLRLYLRLNYMKLPVFVVQSRVEYWEANMFSIINVFL